ncbi:hypothetical protein MKEN_01019700 [Mycena kentingensis (nom. inval.)]|nr:hypothetical protein MKEN_01019700 [Mycena kentingensis (nom. inval.)]
MFSLVKWLLGHDPDSDDDDTQPMPPPRHPPPPPLNLATRPNRAARQILQPQVPAAPSYSGDHFGVSSGASNALEAAPIQRVPQPPAVPMHLPPPQPIFAYPHAFSGYPQIAAPGLVLPPGYPYYYMHPQGLQPPFVPPSFIQPPPPLVQPAPPAAPLPTPSPVPVPPPSAIPSAASPAPPIPKSSVPGSLITAVDAAKSASPYQWVDGNVTFQWAEGEEPPGAQDSGYVYRSSGARKEGVPEGGYDADKKNCQGYLRCGCANEDGSPKRILRPATNKGSLAKQTAATCPVCNVQYSHIRCPGAAYILSYRIADPSGAIMVVRKHVGVHNHPRPPTRRLTEAQVDAIDELVRTNPNASALELRAAAGPGQVPLGEIHPGLHSARKARAEVEKSRSRLGLGTQVRGTSAFGLLEAFQKLKASSSVPWIVESDLVDQQFICMQTPMMREQFLTASVRSWTTQTFEAESGRHGIMTDGTFDFYKQGVLLTSLAFSPILLRWVVVLYTWIGRLDEGHHETHFYRLLRSMVDICVANNIHVEDHLFASILDFSTAQRNGFIEAFISVMITRISGWNELSERSQSEQRETLRQRAHAVLLGCKVHWQRTVFRMKQLLRSEFVEQFENLIRTLESPTANADEFLDAVGGIYREFPELRYWISWWILPGNGAMIFPALQSMTPELRARLSSSTNAVESAHNLLYASAGRGFDLVEGCR